MFGKVIVFRLFEMKKKLLKKKKVRTFVPGSGLRVGYGGMGRLIFSGIRA